MAKLIDLDEVVALRETRDARDAKKSINVQKSHTIPSCSDAVAAQIFKPLKYFAPLPGLIDLRKAYP
jgi:hypothetical protein